MARMTREFSLVLLGTGVLTAASFLWPETNLDEQAEKEADKQVASSSTGTHRRGFYAPILFMHRGAAMGSTATNTGRVAFNRGGFGTTGSRISVSS